ncbi:MAG: tryptophan--tRNA ligase [Nanoarchaeota archaeon]|nr:tryptophan--tRNA ligase [Nanoarchaeota archaeon]
MNDKNNALEQSQTSKQVTPWDVKDVVDYDKLIKEFGVTKIDEEDLKYLKTLAQKRGLDEHIFLRRGLFYAHMDLKKVIELHKRREPIFLYTGRSPGSGEMHLGHLIPFQFTKYLQQLFDCNLYIEIPDDEKFLFKKKIEHLNDVEEFVKKDIEHITAVGFNVDKTFIFRTSKYIGIMYPLLLKIAKKITFSQARNTFGFEGESNIGQIFYPSIQIAPTMFESAQCLIPCAIDQNPYFLLQRDFAQKLGFYKNATILSKFLPALTGSTGKMSASNEESAILLTDNANTIKKKINKYAFSGGQETLELHRELGGNCEIDVSFQWLKMFLMEDDEELEQIRIAYESGKLLSGELKKICIEKVQNVIEEHQRRLEEVRANNEVEILMKTGILAKNMWEKNFLD